jgi:mannose PTS system EIIA component
MIGVLIVCHRKMSTAIKETAFNIIGKKDYFEAIEVFPEDGIDGTVQKIELCLKNWESLDGVLVFVDMFGGTPCNSIIKILKNYKNVDVITGVNLPMIIHSLSVQTIYNNIKEFVENILSETQKSIFNLKKLDIFKEL